MADRRLAPVARRQHGLVTRGQALDVISPDALRHLLATRRLEPVRRGVYRSAGTPVSWNQQLLAACLAAGPTAFASFRSAARLWQLEGFDDDGLEITVPRRHRLTLDGVVLHETRCIGPGHTARLGGIPVSSAERTLFDLTAFAPARVVERALDEALRRKLVTMRRLQRVAAQLEQPGRRRSTVMRAALAARGLGFHPGDSAPEARLVRLLVAAGLPRPSQQHRIRVFGRTVRADLAYPDAKLLIEYDGWEVHRTRSAFDADRSRGNELIMLGWNVLRFTSRSSDASIVRTVRAALDCEFPPACES